VCKDKKVQVDLFASDLFPSSNTDKKNNLVDGVGNKHNTWEPTKDDPKKTVEILLTRSVNGVPAGSYPIMEIKVKPTGNLGPVNVAIYDDDRSNVYEDVYNSTPMKIRTVAEGTLVILTFSEPLTGIYDLQVFACVPEVQPTTVGLTTGKEGTTPGYVSTTPAVTQRFTSTPYPCKLKEVIATIDVSNLKPSSNKETVGNLIPGQGDSRNTWVPTDTIKTLTITLPEVNGVSPDKFPIMEVNLTPTGNMVQLLFRSLTRMATKSSMLNSHRLLC
jgi:hypothetical protein